MLKGVNLRTIRTEPQHQTITSHSSRGERQSSQGNNQSHQHSQSQITLASRPWKKVKYEDKMTNSQIGQSERYKIKRLLNTLSHTRKKKSNQKKQQILTSSNVGLKVRRSIQKDYKFSNNYTRDQIMRFFDASIPSKISKIVNSSTSTSFAELDRTKYSVPKFFQNTPMFRTQEERPKSQINGWQVQSSNCSDNPTYQQISNKPSLSENNTFKSSQYSQADHQSSESHVEDMQLRQYSIDIVTPSQLTPSNQDISLRIIADQQNHVSMKKIAKSKPIVQSHPNIVREIINTKTSQSIKGKKMSIKSIKTKKTEQKQDFKQNVEVFYRNNSKKNVENKSSSNKLPNQPTNSAIPQKQQISYQPSESIYPLNLITNESSQSKLILGTKSNANLSYQKQPYTGIYSLESDEYLLDSIPAIRTLNSRIIANQPRIMPENKVNIREPMYLETGRSNLEQTNPLLNTNQKIHDERGLNQSSTLILLVREQTQKLMQTIGESISFTKNDNYDIISENLYQLQEYILSKTVKGD